MNFVKQYRPVYTVGSLVWFEKQYWNVVAVTSDTWVFRNSSGETREIARKDPEDYK